jgi:hypothetical protein
MNGGNLLGKMPLIGSVTQILNREERFYFWLVTFTLVGGVRSAVFAVNGITPTTEN